LQLNGISENQAGKPQYWAMKERELEHPIIKTGSTIKRHDALDKQTC